MDQSCKICANEYSNVIYLVKEMMFGTKTEFAYLKCSECGCLQITEIPTNIGEYYSPQNYYSYDNKKTIKSSIADYLLVKALNGRITGRNIVGSLAKIYNSHYKTSMPWFSQEYFNFNFRILDIGCGSGKLLLLLQQAGFKYLQGIDPYISQDIRYPGGLDILKQEIHNVQNKYDVIMLHHSFEHMSDPDSVFKCLSQILSDDGVVILRIPLVDSYVWEEYGVNWFQIDAPRHFYLHTQKSIELLSQKNNFRVEKIMYDSSIYQIINSEKYSKGISLFAPYDVPKDRLKQLKTEVDQLNLNQKGDQACFFLRKGKEQVASNS